MLFCKKLEKLIISQCYKYYYNYSGKDGCDMISLQFLRMLKYLIELNLAWNICLLQVGIKLSAIWHVIIALC